MSIKDIWLLLLLSIFFGGCAHSFQPLALETRSYSQDASHGKGVVISYDTFGILEVSNNRRYARKAQKQNLKFIPIKLENKTENAVLISLTDLQIFNEYEAIKSPNLEKIHKVRQVSWPYLLFSFFDFRGTAGQTENGIRYNYILPLGTVWGVGNFVVARVANHKFREAVHQYVIFPITLPPGHIQYALLPVALEIPTHQLQIRYAGTNP